MHSSFAPPAPPKLFGLFQKRHPGDDALLQLAAMRFEQAGLEAELYAETPEDIRAHRRFLPGTTRIVVHLPRDLDIMQRSGRDAILALARAAMDAGPAHGLVLHDHRALAERHDAYVDGLRQLAAAWPEGSGAPWLFVEYAAFVEASLFAALFTEIRDLARVSACIDVGHLGLSVAAAFYEEHNNGADLFALRRASPAELRESVGPLQRALAEALPRVTEVVKAIGANKKPIHFHLHDGHPLYLDSPYGLSDHLSFLTAVAIPFAHKGRASLDPMYGPAGLAGIVSAAMTAVGPSSVSYTLEIHPTEGRLPLRDAAPLFSHWRDKASAEAMSYWLETLAQNARLLRAVAALGVSGVRW